MKAYKDWILEKALPFWSDAGFDARHQAFANVSTGTAVPFRCRTARWFRLGKSMSSRTRPTLAGLPRGALGRSRYGIARARLLHAVGQTGQFRSFDR